MIIIDPARVLFRLGRGDRLVAGMNRWLNRSEARFMPSGDMVLPACLDEMYRHGVVAFGPIGRLDDVEFREVTLTERGRDLVARAATGGGTTNA